MADALALGMSLPSSLPGMGGPMGMGGARALLAALAGRTPARCSGGGGASGPIGADPNGGGPTIGGGGGCIWPSSCAATCCSGGAGRDQTMAARKTKSGAKMRPLMLFANDDDAAYRCCQLVLVHRTGASQHRSGGALSCHAGEATLYVQQVRGSRRCQSQTFDSGDRFFSN